VINEIFCKWVPLVSYYTETIPQGWQCPKCKIIHSPTVLSCDCDMASKEGEPQKWETTTDAPDTGYISPQTTV
jgi:hypothetical protein